MNIYLGFRPREIFLPRKIFLPWVQYVSIFHAEGLNIDNTYPYCISFSKYQVDNSKIICAMDNNVYGATELLENIQQSSSQYDLASPYSAPVKQTEVQNVSQALESLYDTVTTENSEHDDGIMYSVLNHGNARMKILHSPMSDEQDRGSDPIYHILEVEESQMYNVN